MSPVRDFIERLDNAEAAEVYKTIDLLEEAGHRLSMPDAKPIGKGLWELRLKTHSSIRILYGFCNSQAVLLLDFKKQQSSIRRHDFNLAKKRLKVYCQ